jgi:hypothetical protein
VLHEAREITEPEINDLDSAVFGEREDLFGRFCHVYLLSKRPGTPESQGSGRGQDYVAYIVRCNGRRLCPEQAVEEGLLQK